MLPEQYEKARLKLQKIYHTNVHIKQARRMNLIFNQKRFIYYVSLQLDRHNFTITIPEFNDWLDIVIHICDCITHELAHYYSHERDMFS